MRDAVTTLTAVIHNAHGKRVFSGDRIMPTITGTDDKRMRATGQGLADFQHGGFSSGYHVKKKVQLDQPSPSIMRKGIAGSGLHQFFLEGVEKRHLTIAEVKRFSSFPDPFSLVGDWTLQWERIGNSVPPLMMRSIALHIRSSVLKA